MTGASIDTGTLAPGASIKAGAATLTLRPIREDDGPLWLELVRVMSLATRYKRGARRAEDLTPDDVRRAVTPDTDKEIAFAVVARREDAETMIGVARAKKLRPDAWEFAIVVLDDWQRHGIGRALMHALINALQARGAAAIEGDVLGTNRNMLDFLARLGFEAHPHPDREHLKRVARQIAPDGG